MIVSGNSRALVKDIILRRLSYGIDWNDHPLFHVLRHKETERVYEDEHGDDVLDKEGADSYTEIFQRDIRNHERDSRAVTSLYGSRAHAEPSVDLSLADVVELSLPVPVHEFFQCLGLEFLPVARH